MKYVRMNCRINTGYKLPADEGFLSDNAAATTAVLRENELNIHPVCYIWYCTEHEQQQMTYQFE
jgi:hypothetical protein